jgi:hypothetical protein
MKKTDNCSNQRVKTEARCRVVKDLQTVQPFPAIGSLAKNLGLPLPVLKSQIGKATGRTYSYVVRTVSFDDDSANFEQNGSAPNFQGGMLTLCTCKHQMRATGSSVDWKDVWVAGFTSRTIHKGRHWLFYLAKIDASYDSHADIWKSMAASARKAKAADSHFLGDIFSPKKPLPTGIARHSPSRYVTPSVHTHRQHRGDKGWHNDINYYLASKYGHPALLVADPTNTFLWDEPMIYFANDHCRNYHKWLTLPQLVSRLEEVK